jgi:Concanavalin A-like lectin/glucanases superfamily/Secretion system C-terminal sorting domain
LYYKTQDIFSQLFNYLDPLIMQKIILSVALLLVGFCINAYAQTQWVRYSFNNGTTVDDNGVYNGSALYGNAIPDRFGNTNKAYNLQYESFRMAHIDCGDIAFLNNANQLTITGWFQLSAASGTAYNAEMFSKGSAKQLRVRQYQDSKIYGYNTCTNTTGYTAPTSALTSLSPGWYHFAYVLENGIIKTYLNGQLYGTSPSTGATCNMAGSSFIIGGTTEAWFGGLDDIHITNLALSQTQVDSLRNLPDPVPNTTPLQSFCYDFNNGTPNNGCGATNNGTYIGVWAGLGSDRFGNANKAYYCGASASGGVNCGDISLLNDDNDFTVAGWAQLVTTSNPNSNRYIFNKGGLALYLQQLTNKMVLTIGGQTFTTPGFSLLGTDFSGSAAANGFVFFALTRKGSNLKLITKKQGAVNGGVNIPMNYTGGAPSSAGSNFTIGLNSDMKADDIWIVNRNLSPVQLDSLYNLSNPCTMAVNIAGNTSFCAGASTTLTASGGASYAWNNGTNTAAATISAAGTYTVTATNAIGCGSSTTIVVTAIPLPTPVIANAGSTLSCGTFTTYQWFLNGAPIATTPTFTATQSGNYEVRVTNADGCVATSPVFAYTFVDTENSALKNSVSISPNPVHDVLFIKTSNTDLATLEISDIMGRMIEQINHNIPNSLDLSDLENGVYFVRIADNAGNSFTQKIIKQ